jgi:hypothetical protein
VPAQAEIGMSLFEFVLVDASEHFPDFLLKRQSITSQVMAAVSGRTHDLPQG